MFLDKILAMHIKLPHEILQEIAARARESRLSQGLSQEGLAKRSGVSLGSLKRFEATGQIALESLLKLALALDALEPFDELFTPSQNTETSLDELLRTPPPRKRARGR